MNPKIKFLILAGIISAVWFGYGYAQLTPWISENPVLSFFVIWFIFDAALMMYVFGMNPIKHPKIFLAFFIVGIALDLWIPPYLVTPAGVITSDPTVITSDVVFYKMIGMTGDVGYWLTLWLTPLLLLGLAGTFLSNTDFFEQVKRGV